MQRRVGAGIGASDDPLLADVRAAVGRLVPATPRIQPAALGDRAVVRGAVAVALEEARRGLIRRLGEANHSRFAVVQGLHGNAGSDPVR